MTDGRLRVGAFGVGRMGRVHLETLVALDATGEVVLAAIGDRHGATRDAALATIQNVKSINDIQTFDSPDAMAASRAVDAVVIASRTSEHVDDALAFATRGIAVMLEKPMADSIGEAAAFCRTLGAAGERRVQIGFQRRYDEAGRRAEAWVAAGQIGRLQETHHVIQDKNPPPEGYQSTGITADMAIHLVFEAMSFREGALPRTVRALRFLAPHYDDRAGEHANIVHVFLTWADGSVAHLHGSRINATGYDNRFSLVGTDGRIDVGEFAGDFGSVSAKLWQGVDDRGPRGRLVETVEFPMTPPAAGHPDFYARFAAAYAAEVREFARRVARGDVLEPGLDVGWKTLLVANLAEASSRQHGRVFTLVQPDGHPVATPDSAAQFAAAAGV